MAITWDELIEQRIKEANACPPNPMAVWLKSPTAEALITQQRDTVQAEEEQAERDRRQHLQEREEQATAILADIAQRIESVLKNPLVNNTLKGKFIEAAQGMARGRSVSGIASMHAWRNLDYGIGQMENRNRHEDWDTPRRVVNEVLKLLQDAQYDGNPPAVRRAKPSVCPPGRRPAWRAVQSRAVADKGDRCAMQ